ncbi:MAG: RNA polymerase sigma factor, partial [Limisphaerales bacterium]
SSALFGAPTRRTFRAAFTHSQLAEEITQNVFAILARKASSLRRHPALMAWIFETTRLEAARALRTEKRHQRRIAALSSEAKSQEDMPSPTTETEPAWKDILPELDDVLDRLPRKDRQVVLQRFYEGKKFSEIAGANGQTEGACKMRLKRALERISGLLRARGMTFSSTILVTALGSELSQSAPIANVAAIAPKALAASSTVPITTLISNSLQTMSAMKTAAVTAASVVVVAAVPYSQQRAKAARIQSELQTIAQPQVVATERPAERPPSKSAKRQQARAARNQPMANAQPRTAESLLASMDSPVDYRALIRRLMEFSGNSDALANNLVWSRVQRMNQEERIELVRALKKFPMPRITKDSVADKIFGLSQMTYPEILEVQLIFGRASGIMEPLKKWAASDPDGAVGWFWEKRATGELTPGFGLMNNAVDKSLVSDLIWVLAESDTGKMLAFYQEMPREELSYSHRRHVAQLALKHDLETGEQNAVRLLEGHDGDDLEPLLIGVLGVHLSRRSLDEGMALVDKYNPKPKAREKYLARIVQMGGLPANDIGIGYDWLLANVSEAKAPAFMRKMISTANPMARKYTLDWIKGQAPGELRDQCLVGWVKRDAWRYGESMPTADLIADPELRSEARRSIKKRWDQEDQEKKAPHLSADLVWQLKNL